MENYLNTLKRNQLIKLYIKFGADQDIKSKIVKLKNDELKSRLLSEEILTKDIADGYLNHELDKETIQEVSDVGIAVHEEEAQVLQEKDTTIIMNKAQVKATKDLQELARKQQERAMEMLVVTIQNLSKNDLEAKKKSDTLYFSNQYFSMAKVVPFGVKCELPRCIVELAIEAKCPEYTPFETFEDAKKAGRLGVLRLVPKYSVVVHGTTEEMKRSEENKRRLGL